MDLFINKVFDKYTHKYIYKYIGKYFDSLTNIFIYLDKLLCLDV